MKAFRCLFGIHKWIEQSKHNTIKNNYDLVIMCERCRKEKAIKKKS